MAKDRSWVSGMALLEVFSMTLMALKWAAAKTKTTVDDMAVKVLELAAADSEVMDWLQELLLADGVKARSAVAIPPKVARKLAKKGLDVGTVIQYLPMILDLLKRFRDRKTNK